ncbi:MAG TPA: 4-(cytidine 5'-diphospho)-2-C-methyl-D-erythritol kinase, partial [Bradyrhizobium sp.]
MPGLIEEGRAKVNLTLRVVGRRVDGYHDLESVVAFADCADRLTLTPGAALALKTTGPLAGDCGETGDNLVLKAAQLLGERVPDLKLGEFTLDKVLPVAAGIGGGSADAAAALRLLARANGFAADDPRLIEVAKLTGADVPVCLASRACDMTGVGETLLPLSLPI